MLPEFKIPNSVWLFLTFATIKVVGEPKQLNLISVKKFVKPTGCLQPSNSLVFAFLGKNMATKKSIAQIKLNYKLKELELKKLVSRISTF